MKFASRVYRKCTAGKCGQFHLLYYIGCTCSSYTFFFALLSIRCSFIGSRHKSLTIHWLTAMVLLFLLLTAVNRRAFVTQFRLNIDDEMRDENVNYTVGLTLAYAYVVVVARLHGKGNFTELLFDNKPFYSRRSHNCKFLICCLCAMCHSLILYFRFCSNLVDVVSSRWVALRWNRMLFGARRSPYFYCHFIIVCHFTPLFACVCLQWHFGAFDVYVNAHS